jgi:hypothetical protein
VSDLVASSGVEAVLVHLGVEIVVTRRGRRFTRLSAIGRDEALAELVRREPARTVEGWASARAVRPSHCIARLSAFAFDFGDAVEGARR